MSVYDRGTILDVIPLPQFVLNNDVNRIMNHTMSIINRDRIAPCVFSLSLYYESSYQNNCDRKERNTNEFVELYIKGSREKNTCNLLVLIMMNELYIRLTGVHTYILLLHIIGIVGIHIVKDNIFTDSIDFVDMHRHYLTKQTRLVLLIVIFN